MFGSTLSTKGGMVSVVKNYLGYKEWGECKITYIPTHFDGNKPLMMLHFMVRYVQIVILALFGNYKITHLHTAERGSFWRKALLAKTMKWLGIKIVMHHHGAEFEEFYAKCSNSRKERIKKVLEMVDVNIVLSKRLVGMIKDKASNAQVEVLYNAVATYEGNPYNDLAKNILFLGRLGERKGTFDLLECISRIDKQIDKEIKFYLCGDGAIEEVKRRIEKLKIWHRIAHVGWIDGEQKGEYMQKTMINVLPSYNEGLPMTILETMAVGIPNISTSIASIPEVVYNGENGFLIIPGDLDALEGKLLRLINDVSLREKFSKASYDLINKRFSLENHILRLKEIYKKLEK